MLIYFEVVYSFFIYSFSSLVVYFHNNFVIFYLKSPLKNVITQKMSEQRITAQTREKQTIKLASTSDNAPLFVIYGRCFLYQFCVLLIINKPHKIVCLPLMTKCRYRPRYSGIGC